MPSSLRTCGARSRYFAGRRSSHTVGCSMMWASTETILASAGSTGAPSGENGVVGEVDPHAQQRQPVGLALCVAAKAHRHTTAEGTVEDELQREHVGNEKSLDRAGDQRAEMPGDPLGGHL